MNTKIKNIFALILLTFTISNIFAASGINLGKIYKKLGLSEDISYTADLEMEAKNVPQIEMKVFFKAGNIRAEGNQGGMKFITITKKDGSIFTYNDAMKTWMKTDMNQVMKQENLPDYKEIGNEKVDGKNCKKFESSDADSNTKSIIYIYDKMIYQVESMDPQGNKYLIKYKNIQKKELEDSLFAPDEGAQVQDLNALMKNLMAAQNKKQ